MDKNQIKNISLHPKKEESLKRFHPWVFSGAIATKPDDLEEGDIVKVYSFSGEFLGVGHYQSGSISIRILSFENEEIDNEFYIRRIKCAYEMRFTLGLIRNTNNTYRLIHGEGDQLPGLIVDIYGNTAVVQAHSSGMDKDIEKVVHALHQILDEKRLENIYYKSENTLPISTSPSNIYDDYIFGGNKTANEAIENDLKFKIDWLKGQKTGFFIDQRENRKLLETYAHNKDVLNMFCYTGGFSVYALRGGAKSVNSVDSSSKAIALTNENVFLNFGSDDRHQSITADGFKYLKNMDNNMYDIIILDPPAFAKNRRAVHNALQGYKRLNLSALEKIKSGGLLFTFSCSQVISKEQFRLAVFSAASISGRNVRILHQLTQPADHPVNIYHPEGEYLKGLVLYVE